MAEKTVLVPWNGQMVEGNPIPIDTMHENVQMYQLADGTTINLRTVVASVIRLKGVYDGDNQPVYLVKSQNVVSCTVPPNLMKQVP